MTFEEPDIFDQIQRYVAAQAEGTLNDADRDQLETLIRSDSAAREVYLEYIADSANLRLWAAGASAVQQSDDGIGVGDSISADTVATQTNLRDPFALLRSRLDASASLNDSSAAESDEPRVLLDSAAKSGSPGSKKSKWIFIAGSLAAAITVAVALNRVEEPAPISMKPANSVATLAGVATPVWDDAESLEKGASLLPGRRHLKSGAARVAFGNGADVIIFAPARFELISANTLRVDEGRLSALANVPTARGFTIETPSATVVDLGTEFGMIVLPSGASETHVVKGEVRVTSKKSGTVPLRLAANCAIAVSSAGDVESVVPRPQEFVHRLFSIDLADVIAGGDGAGRREGGLDVNTGKFVFGEPTEQAIDVEGVDGFRPASESAFIAGTFVPAGGRKVILDPAGNTFDGFPFTDNRTWHYFWAGGKIPLSHGPLNGRKPGNPALIGNTDYNSAAHRVLLAHPNKGVTFDLHELREAHRGSEFTAFRAVCQNTLVQMLQYNTEKELSDVWVFVDGRLRFSKTRIKRIDPAFEIEVSLKPTDRFLTLVTTDGGDSHYGDWLTFGDPRLE